MRIQCNAAMLRAHHVHWLRRVGAAANARCADGEFSACGELHERARRAG